MRFLCLSLNAFTEHNKKLEYQLIKIGRIDYLNAHLMSIFDHLNLYKVES